MTPTDLDLTNLVYHKAEILGLELVDHIVISNSSIDSKIPFYSPTVRRASHLEQGAVCFVQTDMTYKSYKDIEPEIEKARNEYGADQKAEGLVEGEAKGIDKGKREEKIEMVKEMLKENCDINMIVKVSKLSKKEIERIKKDMK